MVMGWLERAKKEFGIDVLEAKEQKNEIKISGLEGKIESLEQYKLDRAFMDNLLSLFLKKKILTAKEIEDIFVGTRELKEVILNA